LTAIRRCRASRWRGTSSSPTTFQRRRMWRPSRSSAIAGDEPVTQAQACDAIRQVRSQRGPGPRRACSIPAE
jgi:hypothetical protein